MSASKSRSSCSTCQSRGPKSVSMTRKNIAAKTTLVKPVNQNLIFKSVPMKVTKSGCSSCEENFEKIRDQNKLKSVVLNDSNKYIKLTATEPHTSSKAGFTIKQSPPKKDCETCKTPATRIGNYNYGYSKKTISIKK